MMKKDASKDLRRERRYPVHLRTSLVIENMGNYGGTILDLSHQGCLVQSYVHVTSGAHLGLNLTVPGEDRPIQIERAQVRWTREPLYGLEFVQIHPQQGDRLRHIIQSLAV